MLSTSVRPGFYPRTESRKGDTVCHEGAYVESVRSSVNHFKPCQILQPDCLCHLSGLLIYFSVTCTFNSPKLMSLMLKELQPFMLFLYWETVSKNQKRRGSDQACLSVCLGFKHQSTLPLLEHPCPVAALRVPVLLRRGFQQIHLLSFSLWSCSLVPLRSAHCSVQGVASLELWLFLPPLHAPSPSC